MRRLVLVVGILAMSLAACSGSSTSFTVQGPGLPAVTGDGAFDFPARRGILSMNLPASLGQFEAVLDGVVFYVKLPAALSGELGGKPWVKVDLNAIGRQVSGVDLSSLAQAQAADPTQAVNVLRGASDVTKLGTENLRGASVTHYKATIDVDKAIANAPPESRDALRQLANSLGTKTFPAEVWVDDQGRMRKLTYSLDLSKVSVPTSVARGSRPALGLSTFTYELYDFGTTVRADVPPADQVTDLAALLHK
jgi:hypothetical protein